MDGLCGAAIVKMKSLDRIERLTTARGTESDHRWIMDVLARMADGASFTEATGLPAAWRADLRFHQRDALIAQAAGYFETLTTLHAAFVRYHTRTWRRTRLSESNPHSADTVEAVFWKILKLTDRSFSRRHFDRILTRAGLEFCPRQQDKLAS